ncbi:excinuclease ABC subunit B [Candidatus Woesebacteria bacterium RIFCSPLOWO2_01_FULL_39_21]|uniref:UvrABC system protein B n=1 Tax=Candidatus Woesebacteria bacterium RIFCSPLOWO2_01_FULL_39_21 TaxID=1802519 RepID=A0A1F8BIM3_9BACT|nr:MAG: excinuclease ABC subunit B [Candidatus Woesebacteria bacterium RIFCSPHIGHO2_01_FULL_39_23]OGM63148.1 MAG: excinuclease ABC subunit B [Candidatus Woesebacteria bacterium RIFCSPLOWO2_01_FULL_39_21]
MGKFKLVSSFGLTGDQSQAVEKITKWIKDGNKYQVLLGVTGSGKTFSVASSIYRLQLPTLIISHNKTLAAQLYQEMRDFFPENAVSFFVSYYDYYQPEAYIPSTDTYIEKDASINELIDKLRLQTTTNILSRKDTIVVASVSCIYNIGSPKDYGKFTLETKIGSNLARNEVVNRLVELQYVRSDFGFHRGTFRVFGDTIDVYPSYQDISLRIEIEEEKVSKITTFDPISGKLITNLMSFVLYPGKHFLSQVFRQNNIFEIIRQDLDKRTTELKNEGKEFEARRLTQKVNYDLEMIKEVGYVKGIENYSRYFDGRQPGEAPHSLLDYFKQAYGKNWMVVVDESHITFPQIRGMYTGDLSRKKVLVDYGFRLPASFDNRPLTFTEFMKRVPNFLAVSATPGDWELSMSKGFVAEQLVRPTGIVDPMIDVRQVTTQVLDILKEVKNLRLKGQRALITTLTKRTAEDLSEFLKKEGLKVNYLHSDVKTLERSDILDELRSGKYDCLVGINLLREGLDLPEVTLVAILDADKEGFLRSEVSLIQTMGRASRHPEGRVILYAQNVTNSMKKAIDEVERRRNYQLKWNEKNNIVPKAIVKPIRDRVIERQEGEFSELFETKKTQVSKILDKLDIKSLTPMDAKKIAKKLKTEMRIAADNLDFELAATIRDKVRELE